MPVTITEIVFRGTVAGSAQKKPDAEKSDTEKRASREQLVQDTVAEVMRLLDRQGAR